MKNIIHIAIGLIFFCSMSYAQRNPPPPQVNSFDHDKYWFYRWRLTHLFLHKGNTDYSCQVPYNLVTGYSIPAGDLEVPAGQPTVPPDILTGKGAMHWGDGTSLIGWYMAVLATEWKLLDMNKQPTAAVEEELYNAMKAYERVDKNSGILFSPNLPLLCSSADGFFGRDDVTFPFIQKYFPNSVVFSSKSEYISLNTDPVTGWTYSPMSKRYQPGGDQHPYNSVDQVSDLMMGFALVVKCLNNNTNYHGFNFKTQAKNYTKLMINYLKRNNYEIIEPITHQVVKYGGIEAQQDAFPLSRAAERIVNESWGSNDFTGQYDNSVTNATAPIWQARQTLAEDVEISKQNEYILAYRHELAAVGNSWQFGLAPVKCYTICIPIVFWCYNIDFWRYNFDIDLNLIPGFSLFFNYATLLTCIPFKPPTFAVNTTDYTLARQGGLFHTELYAMMHQYLNGGTNSISDSFYQNAIATAPCKGPHYFDNDPAFQAPPGWRSSVRWQKRITAFHGGDVGQVFNGLDYMLLYNLWALQHTQTTGLGFHDELNPAYDFIEWYLPRIGPRPQNLTGKYYGFETMSVKGTVTSTTHVSFLSPSITILPGTLVKSNALFSPPANGVNLECDASGTSYTRIAATETNPTPTDIENSKKEYAQYVNQQLAPQLQKVNDDLASRKYVPIEEYASRVAANAPPATRTDVMEDDSSVKLYPNPSSGTFTISSDQPMVEVTLQNTLGQQVLVRKVDPGASVITIDASGLPIETYICVIRTTNGMVVKKWVKK